MAPQSVGLNVHVWIQIRCTPKRSRQLILSIQSLHGSHEEFVYNGVPRDAHSQVSCPTSEEPLKCLSSLACGTPSRRRVSRLLGVPEELLLKVKGLATSCLSHGRGIEVDVVQEGIQGGIEPRPNLCLEGGLERRGEPLVDQGIVS